MAAAVIANADLPAEDVSALHSNDISDLRWFWSDHEADLGVTSNFGAMCEALALYSVKGDREIDVEPPAPKVKLALAVPRRRGPTTNGKPELGEPMTKHLHVSPTRSVPWKSLGLYEGELVMTLADPGDHKWAVKRAHRIRTKLKNMDPVEHAMTLYAAYGPTRGVEEHTRTIRKRFGVLTEIVVGIAAGERRFVYEQLGEPSFVVDWKRRASAMLRDAATAYVEASWT